MVYDDAGRLGTGEKSALVLARNRLTIEIYNNDSKNNDLLLRRFRV